MSPNKISLNIAGLSILVTTPEDEEYVTQIAKELEENIQTILEKTSSASVTNAVLLCAIEYLDGYKKSTRTANNMRSQIKDYLSEAANAKLEYDEELKRNNELGAEIQALRNHLTRLASEGDSSGLIKQLRDEYNTANNELVKLRKRNADLIAQNKALCDKTDAMNTYISGQDREIARLSAVSDELNTDLAEKTDVITDLSDKISGYEKQMTNLTEETERLKTELNILEQLINSEGDKPKAIADTVAVSSDSCAANEKPDVFTDEKPAENISEESELSESSLIEDNSENNTEETERRLIEAAAEENSGEESAPPEKSGGSQTNEEMLSFLKEKVSRPASKLSKKEAFDFDSAIKQVNDKKPNVGARPIKDYDIDISGISEKDAFSDYKIDLDENIVGFNSVRSAPDYKNEDPNDLEVSDPSPDKKPIAPVYEEKIEFKKTEQSDYDILDLLSSAAVSDEPDKPIKESENVRQKPRADKKRKSKNNLLEQLEAEDDAMPNLSWTLDL